MSDRTTADPPPASPAEVGEAFRRIAAEIHKVIIGQEAAIHDLLAGILAGGHVLLVGVPGLAKTLLVRALAAALDLRFRRIQFTPDLVPSDVTGTEVLHKDPETGARSLRFVPGPIFANLILADEINRTPPKTQAALLEAMQEGTVTAGGTAHPLEAPFFVVATRNPIEQEGTYPLPEAQLDRFLLELRLGYPSREEEERIASEAPAARASSIARVIGREDLARFRTLAADVPLSPHVIGLAVGLVRATRPEDPTAPAPVRTYVRWGASPRAAQHLLAAARARALLDGRNAALAGDVRALAPAVLRHRIVPNFRALGDGIDADRIIGDLLDAFRAPPQGGG
ncbi:MAG: AAA family ATPase [Planctomycetes bacterium]|nr:AAA family ATPase [Planctomycetota bacterium]